MQSLAKSFLLPIDGSEESFIPIEFLGRLYPDPEQVQLILTYFSPPLPPLYQDKPDTRWLADKKKEMLHSRDEQTRAVFEHAREVIAAAGFSTQRILEHTEQKEMNVAQQACVLADIRRVDAVVVHKHIGSGFLGFLSSDPTPALLHHCQVSPVWFVDGHAAPSRAAICIEDQHASLRAVDHAAFMLAESSVPITLLYFARTLSEGIESPSSRHSEALEEWLETPQGIALKPFLHKTVRFLKASGLAEERVNIAIMPSKGHIERESLAFCKEQGIGILVLGHSDPGGTWGFAKSSITKRILSEFKNMAVWVTQ